MATAFRGGSDGYRDTGRTAIIVRAIAVTPQGIPDTIERRALRVELDEGVDVHGHADRAVAEDFHDHAGVCALFVEQDAHVWRRSWKRTLRTPARTPSASKERFRLRGSMGARSLW